MLLTHQIATAWQACCYRLRYSLSYATYWSQTGHTCVCKWGVPCLFHVCHQSTFSLWADSAHHLITMLVSLFFIIPQKQSNIWRGKSLLNIFLMPFPGYGLCSISQTRVLLAALILRFRFYPYKQIGLFYFFSLYHHANIIGFISVHKRMCLWFVSQITCALIIVPSISILQKNQSFLMSQVIREDKYRRWD